MTSLTIPTIGIPELPQHVMQERLCRIDPIIEFPGDEPGVKHYIRHCDPYKIAYTWEPKKAGLVTDKLVTLLDIRTYHRYGAPSLFKPSIAEVIAQIPDDIAAKVVAFEMIKSPKEAADLNLEARALNEGYHVATVRLYGREEVHDLQAADGRVAVG